MKPDGSECGGCEAEFTVLMKPDGSECGGCEAEFTVLMKPDGSECGGCEAEFTVLQGYLGPGQGCHRRPSAALKDSSVR
jgi:DNA-directed RNA polymerase subunit RPC12/RpoP